MHVEGANYRVGDVNRNQLFAILTSSMPYIDGICPQGNTLDAAELPSRLALPLHH